MKTLRSLTLLVLVALGVLASSLPAMASQSNVTQSTVTPSSVTQGAVTHRAALSGKAASTAPAATTKAAPPRAPFLTRSLFKRFAKRPYPARFRTLPPAPPVDPTMPPKYTAPSVSLPATSCTKIDDDQYQLTATINLTGGVYDQPLRGGGTTQYGYNNGPTTQTVSSNNFVDRATLENNMGFVPLYVEVYAPGTNDSQIVINERTEVPFSSC